MATIPIHNPPLPFLGLIPGGIRPQVMIRFRGIVHPNGRLQINFQCGPATEPRDDSALHLSIRPQESAIIRNHLQNRNWGPEERFGHSPIYFGQPFDLLVLAEHNQFKIAINGAHFCTFAHRMPYQRIQYVSVDGHGQIQMIGLEKDNMGPSMSVSSSVAPSYSMPPTMPIPGAPSAPPYPMGPTAMPPHGGVPVYPVIPNPPPPYTPYSNPGYPGGANMSSTTTAYPSHDPMYHQNQKSPKGIIDQAKSMINNIVNTKTHTNSPSYPTNTASQYNPQAMSYPMQPGSYSGQPGGYPQQPSGFPGQPGYYNPSQPQYPGGMAANTTSQGSNKGLLAGALGGGLGGALLTGAALHGKKKKKNKMLKYGAAAGAAGLGAYALHNVFKRSSSSSSSSSSD